MCQIILYIIVFIIVLVVVYRLLCGVSFSSFFKPKSSCGCKDGGKGGKQRCDSFVPLQSEECEDPQVISKAEIIRISGGCGLVYLDIDDPSRVQFVQTTGCGENQETQQTQQVKQ